jgi:protein involved in polysaccharide export with SLBB domain
MFRLTQRYQRFVFVVGAFALASVGCHLSPKQRASQASQAVPDFELPKELTMTTHPPYTVAAPDILRIDANRMIPLPPYKIEPLDALYLFAEGAPENAQINGIYPVDPDGTINLGPKYGGQLQVADMTAQEAEKTIAKHLARFLKESAVSVSLAQSKGVQQIRGEHLVRPDGTVGLGTYGSVYVAGMTLPQVKSCIEQHLSRYLLKPEVSVDVGAFNSKSYYVITDFAGSGEQVVELPCTGNETVLSAIAKIGGLSPVSSKKMWIARPAPPGQCVDQILPVDWKGITRRGHSRTNYQILPGDRVFVMSQPLTNVDTQLARTLAPFERLFGATLLGYTTVRTIETGNIGGGFGAGNVVNVNR